MAVRELAWASGPHLRSQKYNCTRRDRVKVKRAFKGLLSSG